MVWLHLDLMMLMLLMLLLVQNVLWQLPRRRMPSGAVAHWPGQPTCSCRHTNEISTALTGW